MYHIMNIFQNLALPKNLQRDIRLFTAYRIAKKFVLIYGIIVLFYREFSLSFTEIMVITTAESIVLLLFEVPSGMFADIVGNKRLVAIGLGSILVPCCCT